MTANPNAIVFRRTGFMVDLSLCMFYSVSQIANQALQAP
jgi:hypothetical protein